MSEPPPYQPPPEPHQPPSGSAYPAAPNPYPPAAGPGAAPPYTAQPRTTSGWAIASLIFGILGGILLSVIFGIIGLAKTKDGRQKGRGLAIAGLVLSGVWVVIIGIAITVAVMSPTTTESAREVKVGDCFANVPSGNVSSVDTIGCDKPHSAEVVGVLTMPDGPFPAQSTFDDYTQKCNDALQAYSSTAMQDSNVDLTTLNPTQDSWARGDRTMACIATLKQQRTGSIKT